MVVSIRRVVCIGLAGLPLVAGIGCNRTRLPRIEGADTHSARRNAEEFYPYGEETAGPVLNAQPRNYDQPRSEATRLQRTPISGISELP